MQLLILAIIPFAIECQSIALDRSTESNRTADKPPTRWNSVSVVPGPNKPVIRKRDKANPLWWFRNADQPKPEASYRPDDKWRVLKWHIRNPLHNFTFYVIGVAD